ncbi:MAG: YceI family protein [Acidobacteriota bacterium]|nr:YceI family protein [Acidobacteriota bacterium]
MTARSILALLPLILAPGAFAQHQTFAVNPDASQVAFFLGGADHGTHGTFHLQSGMVDFDRSAPKISGSIVVAAGSGNTGNQSRDHKMITEVLDAAHFGEITFVPQSYQGTIAASGDSTIQVAGVFTLHGTPHDLTVPMQIHIDGANCTAKTHFTVPYVKWGLKDPSIFILKVAKEVSIDLTLTGRLNPAG